MPSARFQPSFAAGVLGPGLHGRIDVAKYDVGLKIGTNVFIHTHGGVSNRAGTEFIAEVWDHADTYRLIPFQRDDDDNYVMVMGDSAMQIVYDGAWVETAPNTTYQPATPFPSAALPTLDYVQSIDVMYFAHPTYAPRKMSRTGATSWVFATIAVDPSFAAPTGLSATPNAAGSQSYTYVVSPVVDGVEGFASAETTAASAQDLTVSGAFNTVAWTGGATEYNIYRERSGVFGYIGYTSDTTFKDDNISPNLEFTPREPADLFSGAGNYPSAVTIHQQRLIFGASINEPESIWGSTVGDYENFTRSRILQASDRIRLGLSGEQINRVRSMMPLRELLIFTSASEFALSGPNGTFPADNIAQTVYGRAGTTQVKPVVVDDTALFVDRTGRQVRDLRYAFEQDGYAGNDLTIFASHFFTGRQIKEWAFSQSPFSIIWVALEDGTLLSLTYKREHQIWAWTEHDIGGAVESLTSIREGTEDALYLLVRRTIDGSTVRYIERLHTREMNGVAANSFFVDCGITYSGAATATITGLDHLEGEEVVALADGAVVEGLTVASGEVTLPFTATLVHVGLRMESEIETLPPAIDLQDLGAARGRPHNVNKVRVQLQDTRGIEIADHGRDFTPVILTGTDFAIPPELFTGMIEQTVKSTWNRDGTIVIRQRNPLPMTILGISPEISIGRTG